MLYVALLHLPLTQQEVGLGPSVFRSPHWYIPHPQLCPDGTEAFHVDTQSIPQRHCLAEGPLYLKLS